MDIRESLSQLSPGRRIYTLSSLAYHLKKAKQTERLYELLDRAWMQVKLENDKTYQPFSDDINLAIQASIEEKPLNWVQLIRLGLIYATIRELTAMIPPAALGVMAELGQVERSLSFAALINDPGKSAEAYIHIARALIKQGRKEESGERLAHALVSAGQMEEKEGLDLFNPPEREKIHKKIALAYLELGQADRAWEVSLQMKTGAVYTQAEILASQHQEGQPYGRLFQYVSSLPDWQHESLAREFLNVLLRSDPPDDLREFIERAPFSQEARQQAIRDWARALLHAGRLEEAMALMPAGEWEDLAEVVEKETLLALLLEYEFKQVLNRVDQLPSVGDRSDILNKALSSLREVGIAHEVFRVAERLQMTMFEAAQAGTFLSAEDWVETVETFLKIPSPSMAEETASLAIQLWKEEKDSYHSLRVADFAKLIKVFYRNGEKEVAEKILWVTTEFMDQINAPATVDFDFHHMATELASAGAFEWARKFADKISDPSFRREAVAEVESSKVLEHAAQGDLEETTFLASLILDDEKKMEALAQAAAISLEKDRHEQAARYLELIMENAQTTDKIANRSDYLSQRALYHARQGDLARARKVAEQIWFVDTRMNAFLQVSIAVAKNNEKSSAQRIVRQLLSELSKHKGSDLVNGLLPNLAPALVAADIPDDVHILASLILSIEDPGNRLQGLQILMFNYLLMDAREKAMSLIPDALQMLEDMTDPGRRQSGYAFMVQILSLAGEHEVVWKILEKGEVAVKEASPGSRVYSDILWETLIIAGQTGLAKKLGLAQRNRIASVNAYLRLGDFPKAFQAAEEVAIDQDRGFHLARVLSSMLSQNKSIPDDWLKVTFEAVNSQKNVRSGDSWALGVTAIALAASGQVDRARQLVEVPPKPGINQEEALAYFGIGQQLHGDLEEALTTFCQAILTARLYGRERFYGVLRIILETLSGLLPADQLESAFESVEGVEIWWSSEQYRQPSSWNDENYTVPDIFGIGDGSPLILETSPDLERIFADPNPPSPLQTNLKNEASWSRESLEGRRKKLAMAYLQHPDPAVRKKMILLATQYNAIGLWSLLVDLLADTDPDVQKTAAETIWRQQGDTHCRGALAELRQEIGGNTTAYPHLQGKMRLGHERALLALDTLVANAPNPNARAKLEEIIQEQIFIPERYESPKEFSVDFVNMEYRGKYTYEVYRAARAEDAVAFLKTKTVKRDFYYIKVDTPEGVYGRDVEGMYKQQ